MNRMHTDVSTLATLAGKDLGTSRWRNVDASAVAAFADITGDHQWLHVDPVRAAQGPFGAPVAHGFLVLAMVPALIDGAVTVDGVGHVINKGVTDARFLAPVPVGDRIRGLVGVRDARPRPRGIWEVAWSVAVQSQARAAVALRVIVTYLYQGQPTMTSEVMDKPPRTRQS